MSIRKNIAKWIQSNWHICLLFLFTCSNAFVLSAIFHDGFISGWDYASHYVYTVRLSEMFAMGNFRFWLPDFSMGQALYCYYQPLPHILTAILYKLFFFLQPLIVLKAITFILLLILPINIYIGLRWMGLTKLPCVISACLVVLIGSNIGFGLEITSVFKWGFYTQLWGFVLMPIAIGYCYKSFFGKRDVFIPVLLLGVLFLTHVVSAIIVSLAVGLLWFIPKWNLKEYKNNALYLGFIFLGAFIFFSVVLIPTLLGGDYISGYFKLDEEQHLGLGFQKLLMSIFTGELFDKDSIRIFSSLFVGGLGIVFINFIQRKNNPYIESRLSKYILLNIIFSLCFLAGSKTFTFLQHTPLHNNLPFLRLLPWLQFFALPLISICLLILLDLCKSPFQKSKNGIQLQHQYLSIIPIGLILALGGNMYSDKLIDQKKTNKVHQNRAYFQALDFINKLPEGRLNLVRMPENAQLFLPPVFTSKPIGRFSAAGNRNNLGQYYLHHLNDFDFKQYEVFGYNYILTPSKYRQMFCTFNLEPIFENRAYLVYQPIEEHHYFDIVQSDVVSLSQNKEARQLIKNWSSHSDMLKSKNYIAIGEDKYFFEKNGFTKFIYPIIDHITKEASAVNVISSKTNEEIETNLEKDDFTLLAYLNGNKKVLGKEQLGKVLDEEIYDGYYKATVKVSEHDNINKWIVLKVNAHPDWRAKVNGKSVDWIQMSPCFMAVQVPPGKHVIEFEFEVCLLRKSLILLSLFTTLGLALFDFIKKSK